MLQTALKYTKDESLAWQVVQEARERAALAMGNFAKRDDPIAIRSYLLRTTRNVALEWLRRESNGPVVFSSEILNRVADCTADDVSDGSFSEADVKCAVAIYESLPRKRRKVFDLYYFEGLDYEQIAKRLGIKVSTVRSHIRHIVNQTRRLAVGRGERQ